MIRSASNVGDIRQIRPINPWGRKPEWPDGWKNPMDHPLYQVWVDDEFKGPIPVGPQMELHFIDEFLAALKHAIKIGRITGWSDPTAIKV